jgi:uncharacterized protein DUF6680
MNTPSVAETYRLLGISLESWLTIVAILLSPFLAIFAQRQIDNLRERRNRQVRVFRELMITRYALLSARHVEALNAVSLEFGDTGKEKSVLDAWQEYLDHLGTDSTIDVNGWTNKRSDLLLELLHKMSQCLGYKFEKLRIKREVYYPKYFQELETEQTAIRKQVLELTDGTGRRKLPIAVFEEKFPDLKPPERND